MSQIKLLNVSNPIEVRKTHNSRIIQIYASVYLSLIPLKCTQVGRVKKLRLSLKTIQPGAIMIRENELNLDLELDEIWDEILQLRSRIGDFMARNLHRDNPDLGNAIVIAYDGVNQLLQKWGSVQRIYDE